MPERDFFAFCTTLSRPELRTIGELSWVRHLNAGEVLYHAGDPGNALFIVNRGEVDVLSPRDGVPPLRLTRGQVVGDLEVFSEKPRTHMVTAPNGASLQCFPRSNFSHLVRVVPSFFRYLCEQMAVRVLQTNEEAAAAPAATVPEDAPLSGRIADFDLTTVHQTVANSMQTGQLTIRDEKSEVIGAFFFDRGRPTAAQFEHLTGREAFWQLFLNESLSGTFAFSVGEQPMTSWIEAGQISGSTSDLLISALQFRDELAALKKQMAAPDGGKLITNTPNLHWNGEAPESLRSVADRIWDLLDTQQLGLTELYRQCSVCELKIYQVVAELLKREQLAFA